MMLINYSKTRIIGLCLLFISPLFLSILSLNSRDGVAQQNSSDEIKSAYDPPLPPSLPYNPQVVFEEEPHNSYREIYTYRNLLAVCAWVPRPGGGTEDKIFFYNIDNPEEPVILSNFNPDGTSVAFSESFMYIATWDAVQIYDISNIFNIQLKEVIQFDSLIHMMVSEKYLTISSEESVRIYNISSPLYPTLMNTLNYDHIVQVISIKGDTMMVGYLGGALIYDITHPHTPIDITNISVYSSNLCGGLINSTHLWYSLGGIKVYEFFNDGTLELISQVSLVATWSNIDEHSGIFYLSQGRDGLSIVDSQNINSPQIIASVNANTYYGHVATTSDYLYVCGWYAGIHVYNISTMSNPIFVKEIDNRGVSYDVDISGDFAFVTNYFAGIYIYQILDPQNPILIRKLDYLLGNRYSVLEGDFLYTYNATDFSIIDLSDPMDPILLSSVPSSYRREFLVREGMVYIRNSSDTIDLLNATNPLNVKYVGSIPYSRGDYHSDFFKIFGDSLIYKNGSNLGFMWINITHPFNEENVYHHLPDQNIDEICHNDNILYVLDRDSQSLLVYTTNYFSYFELMDVYTMANAYVHQFHIEDGILFAASSNGYNIQTFDISQPYNIQSVWNNLDRNGQQVYSMDFKDKFIFVAWEGYGLVIIDRYARPGPNDGHEPELDPIPEPNQYPTPGSPLDDLLNFIPGMMTGYIFFSFLLLIPILVKKWKNGVQNFRI